MDSKPDPSSAVAAALNIKDLDPLDAYKRAAPRLLTELTGLLSQHDWAVEGRVPRGVVNILHYTWQDLIAGVVHLRPEQIHRRVKGFPKPDETNRLVPVNDKKETESSSVVGNSERKPAVCADPPIKRRKQKSKIGKLVLNS